MIELPPLVDLSVEERRPLAGKLYTSTRPTLNEVWCGKHLHRLAKVYSIQGRRWLCVPEVPWAFGQTVLHSDILDIDDAEDFYEDQWLRCKCGASWISRDSLSSQLDRGVSWIMPFRMKVFRKVGDTPTEE